MKMIDGEPTHGRNDPAGAESRWIQRGIVGAACLLVIGIYVYTAHSGLLELVSPTAGDTYYNLLVQGFRAGQLSLKKEVPPEFAQLVDPYDPIATVPYWYGTYRMHDLSYYKGRFYIYFGVTPALILFWPYASLTGHYLFHRQAVAIFCAIGFLASVVLLRALWRQYFAQVSVGVVAACVLALGLATFTPMLLARCEVYEVAISCGYMLTMLALTALWCALHEPKRRCRWLTAASVAYGLAVGARPNLLFGMLILLVPVVQARRERRPIGTLLMAAIGPITLIGLGLMLYNAMRFDNPFEFGQHYQLGGQLLNRAQQFSLHYLWFNFRVYFLEPARWSGRFPFAHEITVPPLPPGHAMVDQVPFGVLTNIPLVWLALAVPLAWRGRSGQSASILRWFVLGAALLFAICALTLGLYFGVNFRYEVEFLPALVLLAVVGILGLERALAPTSESGQAGRPVWRLIARWGWGVLLGFSVAFNLLVSVERYAEVPLGLAGVLLQEGRVPEAIQLCAEALRLKPDCAEAHYNLGIALIQLGKVQEAIAHYEQAVRIMPDFGGAHYNLGNALAEQGKLQEAIAHYEQVLRIKPDYANAHINLGVALLQLGRSQEAIGHFEQAVRLKPDYAEAHYNLGIALEQAGRVREAIGHYEQALRIKPSFTQAQNGLARLRAGQ
jgi:tetratricopeptide (TPR) repeat protein